MPSSCVTPELLQGHKEQVATRALQTLLQSKSPNLLHRDELQEGDLIWVYYETSSKSKTKGWVKATVVEAQVHRVIAPRSKKGPPMRVVYEDVRIAPHSELTQELMAIPLEDELAIDDCYEAEAHTEAMHDITRDSCSPDRGRITSMGMRFQPCTAYTSPNHFLPTPNRQSRLLWKKMQPQTSATSQYPGFLHQTQFFCLIGQGYYKASRIQ